MTVNKDDVIIQQHYSILVLLELLLLFFAMAMLVLIWTVMLAFFSSYASGKILHDYQSVLRYTWACHCCAKRGLHEVRQEREVILKLVHEVSDHCTLGRTLGSAWKGKRDRSLG